MISKDKTFISIVFYVRNSEKYIENFLNKILTIIDENFSNYELVCVNNESTDSSIDIVKKTILNYKEGNIILNIINISECLSFEEAISIGVQLAIGDFIFEFDVPLIDYDQSLIIEAHKAVLSDIDVVSVSPNRKVGFFQKAYYTLYNFGVSKEKKIFPERFRIITRRALNRVSEINNYYTLGVSVYKNCGLKNKSIFYRPSKSYVKYDQEEFKQRLLKGVETILIYTSSFQKLILIASTLLCILGIILVILGYIIISVLFVSLFLLGLLGTLIIQYLAIIINLSYKKRIELIKSIEKVVK